jgi:hypothetical protein
VSSGASRDVPAIVFLNISNCMLIVNIILDTPRAFLDSVF